MATPEVGTLMQIDPAELMRDNPAALIVNTKSYESMAAYFAPTQMDPPHIVRVATFSADRGEVIRLFVKDGMTRTKYANDHRDTSLPDYPNFRFTPIDVRDVTDSELKNPLIVPLSERHYGQTALTMLQYLRSVVPPTVEHSEIAPSRIAAHLINGWGNMVGPELASKFPALAAISMLDNPNVPIATDAMLHRFLQDQNQLVPDETPEERAAVQKGLMEMASIIRQTARLVKHIAESAFVLVSVGSEVIGGERQALGQIFGLLNTVEANKKLGEAFTQVSERERNKTALGDTIVQVLSQLTAEVNRSQVLSLFSQTLRNPALSYAHILDIFSSLNPLERHTQVRLGINLSRLKERYISQYKPEQLTPTEEQLIENLGRVDYLPEDELRRVVWFVKTANETLHETTIFQRSIADQKDQLLQNGANPSLIQEALTALTAAQTSLLSATSHTVARRRLPQLKEIIAEKKRKISFQVDMHRIGRITDEVYGEELETSQGALIRSNIAFCILRAVGSSDPEQVRPALESLKSLPADLQSLVIRGEMRLKVAQQRHSTDLARAASSATVAPIQPEVVTKPQEPTIVSPQPLQSIFEEIADSRVLETQRIETNNQKLTAGIRELGRVLDSLDLDLKDLSPENQTALQGLLHRLGQYLFDHPDIVRIVKEYPQLLQEMSRLRSARIQQEQAANIADSKTKI